MTGNTISRRKFVSAGALALSGTVLGTFPLSLIGREKISANDIINLGIIGTGNRGGGTARLIKALPGIRIMACCDIIPGNLQRGMQHAATGAKAYTDYRELIEDKNIDAVFIATPLYLHAPMALDAIRKGKHVYLEKTMSYNIPQTLDLVQAVKKSGLAFQVGHQYRYYALYHRIKEIISQNWLGEITHFECQYHRNSNWRFPVVPPATERQVNWRMYKEYSGGLMAELCGHQIDIVNWMLDSHPVKVTGIGGINYWKDGREVYDNVRAVFEYPNGVKSNVSSILSNAYHGYEIRILGSKATLQIQRDEALLYAEATKKQTGTVDGVTGATILNATQGKAVPLTFNYQDNEKRDPTSYAFLDFADCIRTGRKPFSGVDTGKDAAIAVHLANLAMETETFQRWKPEYDS
ncbi:Gfo/Idh/MocA family oxidoreductase [Pedobacter sp. BS3]|uniref:Gfo/Idh/MocA family protein n=1 Tax=Pedobacter sp. BS3 TaxID=2567937 RepID=UPI0011EEC0AF|nr:Gfo/Idh/MocA family oxidoreductase [Pedobacter sp. BS3]TZF83651.1 Gfo/Idh/MocA family oxidoreductase [Pedobacter sp. BS3]